MGDKEEFLKIKVELFIRIKDGVIWEDVAIFRLKPKTRMSKFSILFKGGFVGHDATHEDLGMEQDDLIEVYVGTNWSQVESDVEE